MEIIGYMLIITAIGVIFTFTRLGRIGSGIINSTMKGFWK